MTMQYSQISRLTFILHIENTFGPLTATKSHISDNDNVKYTRCMLRFKWHMIITTEVLNYFKLQISSDFKSNSIHISVCLYAHATLVRYLQHNSDTIRLPNSCKLHHFYAGKCRCFDGGRVLYGRVYFNVAYMCIASILVIWEYRYLYHKRPYRVIVDVLERDHDPAGRLVQLHLFHLNEVVWVTAGANWYSR